MTTTYAIAPAPKLASQYEWDCHVCGHETLARPVFLTDGTGVLAAGTGCAAKLLGLPVAELAADIAVNNLRDAAANNWRVAGAWQFFVQALPGRVTPKFIAEAVRYTFAAAEDVNLCADTYRALNAANRNPRTVKL